MTPVLHQPTAPRLPGCLDGTAKTQFGEPGERCHYAGCKVLLSSYNDRDICLCHPAAGKRRTPRKRGEVASAGGMAVTNAALPPRHTSREEIDMAAEERRTAKERKPRILEYLGEHEGWTTGTTLAKELDIPRGSINGILGKLVGDGILESRAPNIGGGYRLRTRAARLDDHDEVQYPEDDHAPEAPPGAAPEPSLPEQPAAVPPAAPVSGTSQESPAAGFPAFDTSAVVEASKNMPASPIDLSHLSPAELDELRRKYASPSRFAGIDEGITDWFIPKIGRVEVGEVGILEALEQLDVEARHRVLTYAVARWFCP